MARPKGRKLDAKVPVEFTPELKVRYLAELRKCGFQELSAERTGITGRCVRDHLKSDKEFAAAYKQAFDLYTEDVIIGAMVERGVKGVRRAVIGGKDRDEIVLHQQEYSDNLLLALARARKIEFSKGAGEGEDGSGLAHGGTGGGVLIVPEAPHTIEEWEARYSEASKGGAKFS